jgi:hypothetical protein
MPSAPNINAAEFMSMVVGSVVVGKKAKRQESRIQMQAKW